MTLNMTHDQNTSCLDATLDLNCTVKAQTVGLLWSQSVRAAQAQASGAQQLRQGEGHVLVLPQRRPTAPEAAV